jgi:hypothetical protein
MGLDRPAIHPDGFCNFCVAAALQEQVNDLLLTRTQPYWFLHRILRRNCAIHSNPVPAPIVRRFHELFVKICASSHPSNSGGQASVFL